MLLKNSFLIIAFISVVSTFIPSNSQTVDINDGLFCKELEENMLAIAELFKMRPKATSCLTKMFTPGAACENVVKCNKKSIEDWNKTADELEKKCCASWELIDCGFEKNKDKCTDDEFKELRTFWAAKSSEISDLVSCSKFKYGSQECKVK